MLRVNQGTVEIGGDRRLLGKLLVLFNLDYSETSAVIRQAIECGKFENAAELVHKLKGVSGNIGAEKIFEAACQLESCLKQGGKSKVKSRLKTLERAMSQVLVAIENLNPNQSIDKEKG